MSKIEEVNPSVKQCTEYLKQEYLRYQSLQDSFPQDSETPRLNKEPLRLQITPFHTALCQGDFDFVMGVIEDLKINNPDAKETVAFALNTLITYNVKSEQASAPVILRQNDTYGDTEINIADSKRDMEKDREQISLRAMKRYRLMMFKTCRELCTQLPLALVITSGNEYLLHTLVHEGLELDTVDAKGNNIFHELVNLSTYDSERALEAVDSVLHYIQDLGTRKKMFFTPNHQGFKPVELAAKMASPKILLKYMNIEGVYRHTIEQCLAFQIIRYDVTDYESSEAKVHKSLLYHLTEADEPELKSFQKCGVLSEEPFNSWIRATFDSGTGPLRLLKWYWALFYILTTLHIYHFMESGDAEVTRVIALILLASFVILVEVLHAKNNMRELIHSVRQIVRHGKVPVTFTCSYRVLQLIFCFCIIANGLASNIYCHAVDYVQITYTLVAFFGILSTLFFLQLKEGVGHLLVIVQKMLYETFLYSFMFCIICLAFATSFSMMSPNVMLTCGNSRQADHDHIQILIDNDTLKVTKHTDDDYSVPSYSNLLDSIYETVLLVLAIMPPSDIYFQKSQVPGLSQLFYLVLVLVPGLMMVNFLIAITTRRAEYIDLLKDSILKLERLSLVLYVKERQQTKAIQWLSRLVYKLGVIKSACSSCCQCFHKCKSSEQKKTCCNRLCACFKRCLSCIRIYFLPKPSELFRRMENGKIYLETVQIKLTKT